MLTAFLLKRKGKRKTLITMLVVSGTLLIAGILILLL
jgi:hypothetical protein